MRPSAIPTLCVFALSAFVMASPLPQDSSSVRVCDEQQTACLAGAFSEEVCATQHQECLTAVGAAPIVAAVTNPAPSQPIVDSDEQIPAGQPQKENDASRAAGLRHGLGH
ncbi:hypothetical protein SISNIDRAFT_482018 [Sistotremastrum niveocremeum HHB9708]|uniref:Extracellular membrane protein CFEM domain-containing protein n=2 Tax=Sistotremastraceae TaxID=3402574 RepID=A0A164YN70_9AGAM|nr:hypothetical protein SISNIDRAFT_482018 [Sistotremastrum niveocremeum HHB9708]KZT36747.1 hypothetical protein SISSUDRAFT_1063421 [Sistotremastrum suecicum HHB10207 ss-3]